MKKRVGISPLFQEITSKINITIDVIFPIIHGTLGKDGSLQGMLKILDLPFVGSHVLGSAVNMDKDIAKRLLRDAGLAVAPFITILSILYAERYRSYKSSVDFPTPQATIYLCRSHIRTIGEMK